MTKLFNKFMVRIVAKGLRSTWLFKWLDGYERGMLSAIFDDPSDRYPSGSSEEAIARWWYKAWKDAL